MAYKLGLDAKIFHGTAGTKASTEMKNVTDVTLNLETGEADITTRAAEGWRITAATLKEASVEFEMIWDTADAGFNAIQKAYFGNSALSLFVSDGEGNGLDADFVVTSFRTAGGSLEGVRHLQADARLTRTGMVDGVGFLRRD